MNCEFSDEEIREELAQLGYNNVPQDKLEDFKKDLMKLIMTERSKTNSLNSSRTTEPEHWYRTDQPEEQESITGSDVDENFSNHQNQWVGHDFNEDWQYQGEMDPPGRPQTAPPRPRVNLDDHHSRQRRRVAGDYLNLDEYLSEPYPTGKNQNCCRDNMSDTGSESRMMKRKTSRKTADGNRLIDESFADSDSGVFEIYEKIKRLAMRECECGKSKPNSRDLEPPYRIKKGQNKTPSVIQKRLEPPHTRNLQRMDVNDRHRMYKEFWKLKPAIGEDHRLHLRKAVRERLKHVDDIKLKQKVFVPNTYIPPNEKKRTTLRWSVRTAFENYELPEHGFYHEI